MMFDTLRKFRAGQIDSEQLKGVSLISGTIIQNAKLQLQAAQALGLNNSKGIDVDVLGVNASSGGPFQAGIASKKMDLFDKKLAHAKSLGFKNVADAISNMTSWAFEESFKNSQQE